MIDNLNWYSADVVSRLELLQADSITDETRRKMGWKLFYVVLNYITADYRSMLRDLHKDGNVGRGLLIDKPRLKIFFNDFLSSDKKEIRDFVFDNYEIINDFVRANNTLKLKGDFEDLDDFFFRIATYPVTALSVLIDM